MNLILPAPSPTILPLQLLVTEQPASSWNIIGNVSLVLSASLHHPLSSLVVKVLLLTWDCNFCHVAEIISGEKLLLQHTSRHKKGFRGGLVAGHSLPPSLPHIRTLEMGSSVSQLSWWTGTRRRIYFATPNDSLLTVQSKRPAAAAVVVVDMTPFQFISHS